MTIESDNQSVYAAFVVIYRLIAVVGAVFLARHSLSRADWRALGVSKMSDNRRATAHAGVRLSAYRLGRSRGDAPGPSENSETYQHNREDNADANDRGERNDEAVLFAGLRGVDDMFAMQTHVT